MIRCSAYLCGLKKALNESVLCEAYALPTADDLLEQLTGVTIFSHLDANSGCWQIPLYPESRLLTTLNITIVKDFALTSSPLE